MKTKTPNPTADQLARRAVCARNGKACAMRTQWVWSGGKRGRLVDTGIVALCGFIVSRMPCGLREVTE